MTDPQNPAQPTPGDGAVPPVPTPESAPPAYTGEPAAPSYAAEPAQPAESAAPAYAAEPAPPAYAAAPPAAPTYGDQPYAAAPPAQYGAPAAGSEPGKTLGIVALIVVFFASLIGLILGYVARSQSKKAGVKNTPAKVAIILGWIFLVLTIIGSIILVVVLVTAGAGALEQLCEGMPPGEYELTTGGTVTCP